MSDAPATPDPGWVRRVTVLELVGVLPEMVAAIFLGALLVAGWGASASAVVAGVSGVVGAAYWVRVRRTVPPRAGAPDDPPPTLTTHADADADGAAGAWWRWDNLLLIAATVVVVPVAWGGVLLLGFLPAFLVVAAFWLLAGAGDAAPALWACLGVVTVGAAAELLVLHPLRRLWRLGMADDGRVRPP